MTAPHDFPVGAAPIHVSDEVLDDLRARITFVAYENPPGIHTANERVRAFTNGPQPGWLNHVNVNAHDHGGHFIPWENPDAWINDLRRTFHSRRP